MSRPRILIIENSIAVTGALVSIVRSCRDLKEHFDFFFVLPKKSMALDYVQKAGFPVYEFPLKEIRKSLSVLLYIPYLVANTIRLSNLVSSLKIDLINVNDFYNLMAATYRLFGGKVPFVCYVRFLPSKFPQALVKIWSLTQDRFARKVICVSNAVRTQLPFTKKVVVIGNELPEHSIAFQPQNSEILLYPANYIRGKGQEYALESFALIHAKYPEWKLRFIGGDMGLSKNRHFKAVLIEKSKTLGLENQVEWYDFSENITIHYLNAAIVLNFSESESFSMTCLEALYCGRPVIATRCGGPEEIIDDNISGQLVNLGDVKGMAAAIEHLISSPSTREKMGAKGYLDVREKFSFEKTGKKLLDVYNSALRPHSFDTGKK
ncbi:MAG TPA: glycosyltransferase family 4 protein [Chryseolinea sp.]|nr:glycosyltransferase family 4 protein [Chryseolinea sp.]